MLRGYNGANREIEPSWGAAVLRPNGGEEGKVRH
jgi:hypothetical protein